MRTGFGVEMLYAPGGILAECDECEHDQASPQVSIPTDKQAPVNLSPVTTHVTGQAAAMTLHSPT